jgi:hypothetical protein
MKELADLHEASLRRQISMKFLMSLTSFGMVGKVGEGVKAGGGLGVGRPPNF